jgi:dUTP pyrophosphatase
MTKERGFEVAQGFEEHGINLPKRSTKSSAGYDFECAEEITIEPMWKHILGMIVSNRFSFDKKAIQESLKPTLVATGVKSYMNNDEALFMYNRSSNPIKNFLLLTNGVGVVDSDYYSNPNNDGAISFQFINFGVFPKTIKKGERVGQGIFQPYLKADNDDAEGERTGGHGSTGE